MGVLAWVVAPAVAGAGATRARFVVVLLGAMTAGLIWQFGLVLALVYREQRSLRRAVLREALWLVHRRLGPVAGAGGCGGGRWRSPPGSACWNWCR
jgi:hypothetical protein